MLQSKIKGFDDADKLLRKLPRNVQNRVLQRATTDTLKEVALKPIKNAAPRHKEQRSAASLKYGTLFQNIRVARLRKVRKGEKGARVHTGNAFWGALIERGTRHIAAMPWFGPKFRSLQNSMIKTLGDKLGHGIADEAQKLYRGPSS